MTTIVAVARNGRVVMGADRATNVYDRPIHGVTKIWTIAAAKGGKRARLVLGFAGSGALPNVVVGSLRVDAVPSRDSTENEYDNWASAIARAITELAVESHLPENGQLDGSIVLGHAGRLWTLCHMQAVPHRDGLAAVGSGEGPALGALDAALALGHTDLPALVELAVNIGINRDRYSGGTPQVVTL